MLWYAYGKAKRLGQVGRRVVDEVKKKKSKQEPDGLRLYRTFDSLLSEMGKHWTILRRGVK